MPSLSEVNYCGIIAQPSNLNHKRRSKSDTSKTQTMPRLAKIQHFTLALLLALSTVSATIFTGGCVYKINIQQGNYLADEDIDQVEVGWTRSQVRYLLGTPMVADTFHDDRWNYIYYFKAGKSRKPYKRRIIVYFDGDTVSRVQKDAPIDSDAPNVEES